ncbi:hypothetical protein OS493_021610 [Desmophyllum pertusum]|uniref:EF-hand domain-containing protein n=1 Tax=Desmophyllum pertusum TaxID=174260 RepID=A0A9W9YMP0_9CNID|nr:hypothetical protein OS493_021610 [Desmophyllum pertusum]
MKYVEAFKCFDLNENGHLSTKELKYAYAHARINPTDIEVQELVNSLDYDGKGSRNVNGKVLWEVEESRVAKLKPNSSRLAREYELHLSCV